MQTKQTAVEWLIDNLKGQLNIDEVTYIIKRSKEMEKEQIKVAFISGEHQQGFQGEAEQYYNETYGCNK